MNKSPFGGTEISVLSGSVKSGDYSFDCKAAGELGLGWGRFWLPDFKGETKADLSVVRNYLGAALKAGIARHVLVIQQRDRDLKNFISWLRYAGKWAFRWESYHEGARIVFQIENEPFLMRSFKLDTYLAELELAFKVIQEESACYVLTADFSAIPKVYKQILEVTDSFYGLDLHCFGNAFGDYQSGLRLMKKIWKIKQDVNIWVCETGTWTGSPTDSQPLQTESDQALDLMRRFRVYKKAGAEVVMGAWWIHDKGGGGREFSQHGILDKKLQPKKSYYALQKFIKAYDE